MEIDLDDSEIEISDIDILNYIVEMLFEEQLRKSSNEKLPTKPNTPHDSILDDTLILDHSKPNTPLQKILKPKLPQTPDEIRKQIQKEAKKQNQNKLKNSAANAETESEIGESGRFKKQYPKSHILHHIYDADPVKFQPNKVAYPVSRIGMNSMFSDNFYETFGEISDVNSEDTVSENNFDYMPIILTIKNTKQRYFLPEMSQV